MGGTVTGPNWDAMIVKILKTVLACYAIPHTAAWEVLAQIRHVPGSPPLPDTMIPRDPRDPTVTPHDTPPDPSSPDRFLEARRAMIRDQLRGRGLRHEAVLEVMGRIPREHFVSGSRARSPYSVYADTAVPVGRGQTLSQPYMVARMTAELDPQPGAKILEIGTGTGYQTAVLAALAGEVWTVERDPVLAAGARERLAELGVQNIRFLVGDGSLGWPEGAPYQGILVTAGAPRVPTPLVAQLDEGGRMVIPVGPSDLQELLCVELQGGEVRSRILTECRFVPLVGEAGWASPPA